MKKLAAILALMLSISASALDLDKFVGYKIIAKKTIAGYVEEDGSERKSDTSFEGCNYDRKIVFNDNTYLTCSSYSYSYSYRPDALILTNGSRWVMIVNNTVYEMRN